MDLTIEVETIAGEKKLAEHRGKLLPIVNVASKCGFTPRYDGLEKLFETYKDRGFVGPGFPCNQFGTQEPGTKGAVIACPKANRAPSEELSPRGPGSRELVAGVGFEPTTSGL